MGEVILGCYEDNFGSNKTIINNNGVLYKKSKMKDKDSLYYKINL
jgi:predicted acetyltransferase